MHPGLSPRHRVRYEAVLHRPAPTASRRAHSVHVPGDQVAKSVLVRADDRFVLAVLPSTHRIDLDRLAAVLEVERVRLATEDELTRVFTDCERGAVPPFGRLYGLATVVDTSLAAWAEIVVEANLRHEDLRLRYRDFEAIEDPVRARFARPIAPRRPDARPPAGRSSPRGVRRSRTFGCDGLGSTEPTVGDPMRPELRATPRPAESVRARPMRRLGPRPRRGRRPPGRSRGAWCSR